MCWVCWAKSGCLVGGSQVEIAAFKEVASRTTHETKVPNFGISLHIGPRHSFSGQVMRVSVPKVGPPNFHENQQLSLNEAPVGGCRQFCLCFGIGLPSHEFLTRFGPEQVPSHLEAAAKSQGTF